MERSLQSSEDYIEARQSLESSSSKV